MQTSTAIRLSVQFLHNDQPTASLAVWTYIILSEAMQHTVLLGRDSWIRFSERSCSTSGVTCDLILILRSQLFEYLRETFYGVPGTGSF